MSVWLVLLNTTRKRLQNMLSRFQRRRGDILLRSNGLQYCCGRGQVQVIHDSPMLIVLISVIQYINALRGFKHLSVYIRKI